MIGVLPDQECGFSQFFTMHRMGNIDKCFCTFSQIFSVQIGNPVFGNNIVNVCPGGDHTCTALQERHNFTFTLEVTEGRAMMGLPPSESEAPRIKSIWPPTPEYILDPMESAHTCPLRSISNSTVDGSHFWILPDDMHFVHITDIQHFDYRVIMYETV